jgi:membrane dipeptidase
MLIIDAHLDLAYNALNYGRQLELSLADLRSSEPRNSPRGQATVTWPELKRTGVGLVFGTLFVQPASAPVGTFGGKMVYRDADEAHRHAMSQLDYYHRLADEDETICLVGDLKTLEQVVTSHEPDNTPLLGIVPLMEGADPIRQPEEAEYWYERGLRLVGLAWDDTRYAAGAWRGGNQGLSKEGNLLLEVMGELSLILDLTHMSEKATLEALERYEGPVVASHSNARALVPGERQLSDLQIRLIGERGGVIGVVLANSFLRAHHHRQDPKQLVTLDHVVAHVDHMCQVLGDASHVGVGSDLDGGFGREHIPAEMDSIHDLSLIADKLRERGYESDHIVQIMGGNWLRVLRGALPA